MVTMECTELTPGCRHSAILQTLSNIVSDLIHKTAFRNNLTVYVANKIYQSLVSGSPIGFLGSGIWLI